MREETQGSLQRAQFRRGRCGTKQLLGEIAMDWIRAAASSQFYCLAMETQKLKIFDTVVGLTRFDGNAGVEHVRQGH